MQVTPTRLQQIVDKLKQKKYRMTPQRLAILDVLANSTSHPSVDQVYQKVKIDFPMTSLATVYKTIGVLKEVDEVLELGFGDDSNRYDGNNPNPHPHLVCTECRKIIDPDLSGLKDMTVELSTETGFKIVNHRLDFYGICPECQNSE